MDFIESVQDIKKNIKTLNTYLAKERDTEEFKYGAEKIRRGRCFIVVCDSDKHSFSPSRFVGYKDNNMFSHEENYERNGNYTNSRIMEVLKKKLITEKNNYSKWIELEKSYKLYCDSLGVAVITWSRKYWDMG